ncbi:VWA domain-containing protein [Alginatibacterium sediminis]|uniref:VWA domain-containing protein n=1 Tax=Alginatibacterium sediminis TaxID=2164068 RepID=A0A420EI59_9ALTE|nr:VWA domain-containing protein [Alginatibacterium sediminis]RKF20360.1 VWA domain-containing protein [Alginatibacterium sediminis]
MIEFAHPWAFILCILPYAVYRFAPPYQTKQSAVQVPFFDVLVNVLGLKPSKGATQLQPTLWQRASLGFGWLLLVVAMAKPVWLDEPQTRDVVGRDLMVVVDLSGSMATEDFSDSQGNKISRLDAAKNVLSDFSQQRKGDRLGLILFGDSAFLQSPFTADHKAWTDLLMETRVAMAGAGTHLGDAIGLGIKTFRKENDTADTAIISDEQTEKQKVLIVLTDGNDTNSLVPPIEAAKIAAQDAIRIYMVAIGDPVTVGENAMDMDVIEQVATLTQGKAFVALSPSELTEIYQTISELEPALFESFTYQAKVSIHHIPILILMLNYLIMMCFYTLKRYVLKEKNKTTEEAKHGI